ncbi:glycoside hydrolase family 43 protein [Olivibacter domesticus]|uniref:Glycosyl hydrolases family 43 n=1 Tax=Olivibacter domesticus TaxID=407022 RepID=A0A1H7TLE1_OLID1|nr:glycoside hydrolase family 43 protein [Olivibacter domesticus]SEL85508.1 Glycosyl hydrolases family 43 [Olivibacter domesticus]
MNRNIFSFLLACMLLTCYKIDLFAQNEISDNKFIPKALWLDTEGHHINAHGGGIVFVKGTYYWYGEKRGDKTTSAGVSVYSSKDLYHWKNEGIALSPVDDDKSDLTKGCIIERPKVIYNKKTKKFVMWFHLELKGQGYAAARAGVAIADQATGPFKYLESFRPNGNMSRDMGLFVDEDGTAYHIYSSDENYALRIAKLTDDYLRPTKADSLLFRKHQEAPAIFKYKGKYYLITSACTGWAPNQASIHEATNIFGPWKFTGDPMKGPNALLTFGGQSTFILPVQGKRNAFIFMADVWRPKSLQDSRYIWLPIKLAPEKPVIEWVDNWDLDYFN